MSRYVIVPGWGGSGPAHWQSVWEREFAATRIAVADWEAPERGDWIAAIDRAVRAQPEPPVLIAHSLGCIAIAHWASVASDAAHVVAGALLVAPPDLDRPDAPDVLRGFAPCPRAELPFPSRVVGSADDPNCARARLHQYAADWGSALTALTDAGHINVAAGFGEWPAGRALLATLLDEPYEARGIDPGSPWLRFGRAATLDPI